jgi:hypothetical protein
MGKRSARFPVAPQKDNKQAPSCSLFSLPRRPLLNNQLPSISRFNQVLPLERLGRLLVALILFAGIALAPRAEAQASKATATRNADLQIGGQFTYATESDFGTDKMYGGGGYITYDFAHNLGVELNFHQVNGTDGKFEQTYEAGVRYVKHLGIIDPYIRGSYGRGRFSYPEPPGIQNPILAYNLVAGAGGVDIRVLRHVNVRGDYEFQYWPKFAQHGLSPQLASIGAAYHF